MSIFGVILVRIQSESEKMRTRITPKTDIFHAVEGSENRTCSGIIFSMYLYLHLIIEKFGIIKTQALKVFKKQFQILIGLKHLGTRTQMKVVNY